MRKCKTATKVVFNEQICPEHLDALRADLLAGGKSRRLLLAYAALVGTAKMELCEADGGRLVSDEVLRRLLLDLIVSSKLEKV